MANKNDADKFAAMSDDEVIEIDDGEEDGEAGDGLGEELEVGDEFEIHLDGGDEEEDEDEVFDDALQVFESHGNEPVYAVAAAHGNSDLVASGGGDDKSFSWSVETGQGNLSAKHGDSVVAVAFNATDEWLASGGMDGIILCKHLKSGREVKLDGPSSEIEWVAWHPQHLVLIAGSSDTTVWMFNVAQEGEAMMGVMMGHQDSVTCGSFTANGRRILTGSLDGTMKMWEPNGCALIHTFSGHGFHEGGVVALVQKSDEPVVATGGSDGTVCLSRLDSKKVIAKLMHADMSNKTQQQQPPRRPPPRGEEEDGEEEEEEEEEAQEEEGCSVETLAFCPTLPWLVSGGTDGRVVVWDLSVQAKRSVLAHPGSGGQAIVRCLFLPNSVKLITACADGKVRKFDARASSLEKTYSGHTDAILDMVALPDGKRVVTGSDDGTCRVFLVVE